MNKVLNPNEPNMSNKVVSMHKTLTKAVPSVFSVFHSSHSDPTNFSEI